METVKVRIKESIAKTGSGFHDLEGKQSLIPRDKANKLQADMTFEVRRTPFINQKIQSGEIEVVEAKGTQTSPATLFKEKTGMTKKAAIKKLEELIAVKDGEGAEALLKELHEFFPESDEFTCLQVSLENL